MGKAWLPDWVKDRQEKMLQEMNTKPMYPTTEAKSKRSIPLERQKQMHKMASESKLLRKAKFGKPAKVRQALVEYLQTPHTTREIQQEFSYKSDGGLAGFLNAALSRGDIKRTSLGVYEAVDIPEINSVETTPTAPTASSITPSTKGWNQQFRMKPGDYNRTMLIESNKLLAYIATPRSFKNIQEEFEVNEILAARSLAPLFRGTAPKAGKFTAKGVKYYHAMPETVVAPPVEPSIESSAPAAPAAPEVPVAPVAPAAQVVPAVAPSIVTTGGLTELAMRYAWEANPTAEDIHAIKEFMEWARNNG